MAAAPLIVLVHELGHALAALRFSRGRVRVEVGRRGRLFNLCFGRLTVVVSLLGVGGECLCERDGLSRTQHLVLVLAGPAVNLLLFALLATGATLAGGNAGLALAVASALSAVGFAMNMIPMHGRAGLTRGLPSDGLTAWCLIRGKAVPPTKSRTDRRPLGTRSLSEGISAAEAVLLLLCVGAGVLLEITGVAWQQFAPWAAAASLLGVQAGARTSEPPAKNEPTKRCPNCREEILASATVCFCYHSFAASIAEPPGQQSLRCTTTSTSQASLKVTHGTKTERSGS